MLTRNFTMPFKQRFEKKAKPMVSADKTTILRVEPYNLCGKHMLRPFAKDGSAVFVPKGVSSEKKLLTATKMVDRANAQNSELCRRPLYGLSFAGASVQELKEFARGNADEVSDAIGNAIGIFSEDNFQPLLRALEFLNQDNDIDRDEKTAAGHIDNMFSVLKEHTDELEKKLRKAIMISSRMYLGSVALLELMALVNDSKKWAKKIEPQKQQPKAVRTWLEDPKNEQKAKKALVKLVSSGSGRDKKKSKKPANLDSASDESKDAASSEASSSGKKAKRSASPLSSQSDSHTKKKQRKHSKKDDDSDDSSSGKKAKKEQKQKKRKIASSSSSGTRKKMDTAKRVKKDDKQKEKPSKAWTLPEEDEEEVDLIKGGAAVSVWPMAKAQQLEAKAKTWVTKLGDSKEGPTLATLQETFASLPEEVLDYAELSAMKSQLATKTALGRAGLQAACDALIACSEKVLQFLAAQSSGGASGSATAATSAVPASEKDNKEKKMETKSDGAQEKKKEDAKDDVKTSKDALKKGAKKSK